MSRLFILDALGLAYRAYHAIRTRRVKTPEALQEEKRLALTEGRDPKKVSPFAWEPLCNSKGEPTNAIFGFGNMALKIRSEQKPDYWALAWDGPGPTFRRVHHQSRAPRRSRRAFRAARSVPSRASVPWRWPVRR